MYVIEKFYKECEDIVKKVVKKTEKKIKFEIPPREIDADLSLPCFTLSNNPNELAKKIEKQKLSKNSLIGSIDADGPYINFSINRDVFPSLALKEILNKKEKYGSRPKNNKKILIDFSSPNIAKPMSVGHLRSTIIGKSLYNIFEFLGYECIGDNHLGDWGTQFGKLICAYKRWGNTTELKNNPIRYLNNLYVKFHEKAKTNPKLNDEAKLYFKKLENGEKNIVELWKLFSKLSMEDFQKIYDMFDIKFDLKLGESFYYKKAKDMVKTLLDSKIALLSDDAIIIPLANLPPLLIQKSDETTLYATRDLAAIDYRNKKFKPEKILYVVGSDQSLYFKQLFSAAKLLGYPENFVHVNFGMVLLEKKMSTRSGRVVFLEDLINKSIKIARRIVEEKNPKLMKKDEISQQIGLGAIIFNDLKQDRIKDIRFDWKKMLSFEGDSCPYIQYAYVRALSILKKAKTIKYKKPKFKTKKEIELMKKLSEFPTVIEKSAEQYKPHFIAQYLLEVATEFNEFYSSERVLGSEREKERLLLVYAVSIILKNGLNLLNIKTPNEM